MPFIVFNPRVYFIVPHHGKLNRLWAQKPLAKLNVQWGWKEIQAMGNKIFAYLRIKWLRVIAFRQLEPEAAERNAKLIQFLDDPSLGLVMTQTRDNGFQAPRILGKHYVGCSKSRIITYH